MNFDSEYKRIILSIWMHGEHLEDAKLIPPSFFDDYAKVAELLRTGEMDLITLSKKGGVPLKELALMLGRDYSLESYESIMLHYTQERRKEELQGAFDKGASIDEIERILNKFHREDAPKVQLSDDLINDYLKELDERSRRKFFGTGLMDLDNILSIRKGELTSVGARPSTGKSTFMLQVAKNIIKHGGKVLFLPLEMTQHQTMDRMVLSLCSNDLDSRSIKTGVMTPEQYHELSNVLGKVEDSLEHLTICDTVRTLEGMEQLIDEIKPDVVIIDQLQQMTTNVQQFNSVRERFSYMTSNLKRVALEKNVAVWLACQLNRSAADSTPSMEQLKESGSIEEDSDNVILLGRNETEENGWSSKNRLISCIIAKQREAATGQCELMLIPDKFTFRGIEKGEI